MKSLSPSQWDRFLQDHPESHLLQASAWGELKAHFGWRVERLQVGETGAQVLFRPLPLGFSFAYLPKGPVGPDWVSLWPELDRACRRRRAILLKVEPDDWEAEDRQQERQFAAMFPGFVGGADPVQPRRTAVISLDGSEEDWLARMKQKTRYNIRLAEKKDVVVRPSDDLGVFYQLMQVTGARDGFGVHSLDYFQKAYDLFAPQGMAVLLIAEYAGRPLAGLIAFATGKRSWYFYGASNDEERNRMPTYLLQWEAMRWAKSRGCEQYDLWGIPDAGEAELEANFANRSDGLWGVYRFKRGFGAEIKRSAGAWDKPYIRAAYPLYRWWSRRRHESG